MEANAAPRTIVRRVAAESGIETRTGDDLIRLDRTRPGKKLSTTEWESPTDPDARITRTEDGRTHVGGVQHARRSQGAD
jgi:transposase